ncbi:MAG: hypothetical protein IV100_32325 [Myxococcales bacterium]|nr:hypothetical protein [Myxococcales bacterium]
MASIFVGSLAGDDAALRRLPHDASLFLTPPQLNRNPLPVDVGDTDSFPPVNSRSVLPEIFAATTALAMIRDDAATLAIGLQDLALPALVTLEIIDAAFPNNSIPMFKKWNLVTAVKHFHERR